MIFSFASMILFLWARRGVLPQPPAGEAPALVAEVEPLLDDAVPDGAVGPPRPAAPNPAAPAELLTRGDPPEAPHELVEVVGADILGYQPQGAVLLGVRQ